MREVARTIVAWAFACAVVCCAVLWCAAQPGTTPRGGLQPTPPPVPGAPEYVNLLLNPARALTTGSRIDLWSARRLDPTVDGLIERTEWAGAMELSLAFATEEQGPRGYSPRAAICIARGADEGTLVLAMACEDETVDAMGPAPEPPQVGAPVPEHDPWAGCDSLDIIFMRSDDDEEVDAFLRVARSGEIETQAMQAEAKTNEFGGCGWAAETRLSPPARLMDERGAFRIVCRITDGSGPIAVWPPVRDDGRVTAGLVVTLRPGG